MEAYILTDLKFRCPQAIVPFCRLLPAGHSGKIVYHIYCQTGGGSWGGRTLANIQSAKKRIRSSARKRARNQAVRTATRTYVRRARSLIAQGKLEEAEAAMATAYRALDRAVTKGVIHANNAARRKSRLMKHLNRARESAG